MRQIINGEILSIAEWKRFKKAPYSNSDFHLGRMVNDKAVYQNLLENLLLYDQVHILTTSFEEVVTIRDLISGHNLERLLHNNAIKFVQIPYSWGYIQKWKKDMGKFGMSGLVRISLADERKTDLPGITPSQVTGGWSSEDLEEAVCYTLTKFHSFNTGKVRKFARLVGKNTTRLGSEDIASFIQRKSEDDLTNVSVRNHLGFDPRADIDNIPDNSSDIRRLFRIILANQFIAVAQCYPEADLLSESYYTSALKYAIISEIKRQKFIGNVNEIFDVHEIPRPSELGYTSGLRIEDIIRLRESKEGKDFREWLHKTHSTSNSILESYLTLLKKKVPFTLHLFNTVAPQVLAEMTSLITKTPIPLWANFGISAIAEFATPTIYEKYISKNPPKMFLTELEKTIKSINSK